MIDLTAYHAFLEAKKPLAHVRGIEVDLAEINPGLKPHVRLGVQHALRAGRQALFWKFGLHKTSAQLEIMRLLARVCRAMQDLGDPHLRGIVLPLGVRKEFMDEVAKRFQGDVAVRLKFIRRTEELEGGDLGYLMNYESVREGLIDLSLFGALSLDEAAVLRSFGSKTFGELNFGQAQTVDYRFVATATPDPNEYLELIAYAHFLGVMDMGEAKTRFFRRNSEKADQLTLHPHKEEEFWLWVASWAMFIQRPSDLGFSDEGYDLPALEVRWHEIPTDHVTDAGEERDGQARMFKSAAIGVSEAAREKRDSLDGRVHKLLELRAEDPGAHRIIWHDLEAERAALEDALPEAVYEHWQEFRDGNARALEIFDRHYTSERAHLRKVDQFVGPGQKLVLLTAAADALFAWRKHISDDGQQGVNCAVFRNEGPLLSSDLILEAMAIAWLRWPGERLYTYVDPEEIESTNPGYCFIKAGWRRCGMTKGGLVILEALPGTPVPSVAKRHGMRAVYGSQDLDVREDLVALFAEGELPEIAAKPVMLGAGPNLQRFCSWEIFLGIGFKFNEVIQGIHRVQRFGQRRPVRIDFIYTEAERPVRQRLEAKWVRHEQQAARMSEIIRKYGLSHAAMSGALTRAMGVERREEKGERWTLVNNDSVAELARLPADSVDMFLTSIPFSTQYEYSPSYNDFGHTDDEAHFFAQMDFLTPSVVRALKPGRVLAVHCKNRIMPGALNGIAFQTVSRFAARVGDHYERHGLWCIGEKFITTDVVRENKQTYRLGYGNVLKDSTRLGCGLPEYLLLFRKAPTDTAKGWADKRVVKSRDAYSCGRWQYDAHAFQRSSGNRLLSPEDLVGLKRHQIWKLFKKYSLENVYDHERYVAISEALDKVKKLPHDFFLVPPQSWHPDVWSDVTRMRTLNGEQARRNREKHLCPLPFDIVDRAIKLYSEPGEVVADYFAGIGTVPLRAMALGRIGWGCELNPSYFDDGVWFLRREERGLAQPTLQGLDEIEEEAA